MTFPGYSYNVVGWPASQVTDFVGTMSVGDTIHLYFVRQDYKRPCEGLVDTVRDGGTWVITKPYGGSIDSSIAAVTQLPDGSAIVRAKSAGEFGVWFERDAPAPEPLGVWQHVTICPGDFTVFDFRVS